MDTLILAVAAWPLVWAAAGMVYYTGRFVGSLFSGRTVVPEHTSVTAVAGEQTDLLPPDLEDIVSRVREENPLLTSAAEILTFDPGPCVSVVGVLTMLIPSDKGGLVGWLVDRTGEVPVWLPDAGVVVPSDRQVVVIQGRVRCTEDGMRWLQVATWGDAA